MNHDSTTATSAELFLAQLRSQTAASHKNLEELPVSTSLLSSNVTKESYAHYLTLMHDVVADTEARIFPLTNSIIPDLAERRKLAAITADLKHLGVTKDNYKPIYNLPENVTTAFALGILYVIEGSSLGGRFILNNINSVLAFDENGGATYFAGYGNKSGSLWKHFLQNLTVYQTQHDCAEEIIAGADFAFRSVHEHFSENSRA